MKDRTVDARVLLGRSQDLRMLLHAGAAIVNPLLVDEEAQIVPDRHLELWLDLRKREDAGVRLHMVQCRRRHDPRHTRCNGSVLQARNAGCEIVGHGLAYPERYEYPGEQ